MLFIWTFYLSKYPKKYQDFHKKSIKQQNIRNVSWAGYLHIWMIYSNKKQWLKIVQIFHNITVFTVFFYKKNLKSIKVFHKHKMNLNNPKFVNWLYSGIKDR